MSTEANDNISEEAKRKKALMDESYRDALATVDEGGKRVWIYPKKPSGKFYNYRTWVSIFLLVILFGAPFVRIGGEPLVLLNVLERKFVLFGQVFWPQDFHLFVLGMLISIIFITLFTVVYGRIFCGWVCPQTIFMEMVFRKIEYWIEGDWTHQKKLNKQGWDAEKIRKKGLKHGIFFLISFLIANTFLAYIIGSEALFEIMTDNPAEHLAGLGAILVFSFAFYFVFSQLREQVCTTICPYGRLQGVLLDRSSVVVAYDYVRGENRAKFKKGENRAASDKGDCIDCKQCVHVCPTGIDIRNGTQLECVNCTACIDACDHIMEGVGLPKGLIRYASEEEIAIGDKFKFTTRMKAYSALLVVLVIILSALLFTRTSVESMILHTPGTLPQIDEVNETVKNLYNYKVINKTNDTLSIEFIAQDPNVDIELIGKSSVSVLPQTVAEGALFMTIANENIKKLKTVVPINVVRDQEVIEEIETMFLGPVMN